MSNKKSNRKPSWRNYPDANWHGYPEWPSPESLHPTERTIVAALCGDESAASILSAYRFSFPVTEVVR